MDEAFNTTLMDLLLNSYDECNSHLWHYDLVLGEAVFSELLDSVNHWLDEHKFVKASINNDFYKT